ncbi:CMRF35-like molecule 5 isoform X1 [Canis lupus familiaris]|uniref:Ig-like domain-containing protein n=2 Tax=Canis lupus familiaris TaxID=9615 RepID=A0A8C0Q8L5_CANLF|nr:CMRF35-like molecule 5 isoform X1 [Canis lupus familiaris]XP_025274510.3 CMRF35-like molecule 5 isoform X1 [Canis lupus dingo]XP_038539397.1 CMRF35-like molecule 5 isoform X1 [Canis lupus familiaris]|eukprot:XP_013973900.1 CMRF35-like molecule 5 [Canis lupus familiaris]
MARDATRLLPPVLLVLLASGSWEQKPELLRKLEGETISVKCLYQSWQDSKSVKAWCRQVSARTCTVLASYPRIQGMQWKPGNSIQDWVRLGYFIVTMTKLKVEDSGFYSCGIYKSSEILTYRNIHLVVSPAPALPITRSSGRTTAWTFAPSPVMESPQSNWHLIVPSSTVAVLLLLVLTFLMILYLRKARRSSGKGEDKSHHIYNNISVQKEQTTVHGKDPSSRQRRSQLSWGSSQHMGSEEDTGAICYASLTHLNHFVPEDSIYVNIQLNLKPIPDPLLTVEYADIAGARSQPSKSTAPDREFKS